MSDNLKDFLGGEAEPENAPPVPEVDSPPGAQEHERKEPEKDPAASPEGTQPAKPEGEPEPEAPDGRHVPLRALEAERKQRQDWKDRAARAEAERDALMRQLEEAKKAPPPAPPQQQQQAPQPPPLPDPETNPAGYIAALIEHNNREAQRMIVEERFGVSETLLRQRIGDAETDAVVAEFKAAAEADPLLMQQLHRQRDPFGYAHQTVQRIRALREVGDDPAAYKARLRAEWEAEMAGQQQPPPAAPALPPRAPSLARVNGSAGRAAPDFTGPPPMEDILRR